MVLMELDPADQRPVYRQIVEEIERCVAVGVIRHDEALPAAAALAKDLKVNINTVQHAYQTMAQSGTVYIKRGLGTFISPAPRENRQRTAVAARRIAERMLREGYKQGLLASDLIAALHEIAPKSGGRRPESAVAAKIPDREAARIAGPGVHKVQDDDHR